IICRHANLGATRDVDVPRVRARVRRRRSHGPVRRANGRRRRGARSLLRLRGVLGGSRTYRDLLLRAFLDDDQGKAGTGGITGSWRREWDSNPRYAINVYTLSKRAP